MTATEAGHSSVASATLKDVLCKGLRAGLESKTFVVCQPLLEQIDDLWLIEPTWCDDVDLQEIFDVEGLCCDGPASHGEEQQTLQVRLSPLSL